MNQNHLNWLLLCHLLSSEPLLIGQTNNIPPNKKGNSMSNLNKVAVLEVQPVHDHDILFGNPWIDKIATATLASSERVFKVDVFWDHQSLLVAPAARSEGEYPEHKFQCPVEHREWMQGILSELRERLDSHEAASAPTATFPSAFYGAVFPWMLLGDLKDTQLRNGPEVENA